MKQEKKCPMCTEVLSIEYYQLREGKIHGAYCKKCHIKYQRDKGKKHYKEYYRDYYKKNKEKIKSSTLEARNKITQNGLSWIREYNMLRTHKLTGKQYLDILSTQNNKCKICQEVFTDQDTKRKRVHIDHCHTTGKVRGILCQDCNHGIGKFKESIEILERARKYIIESNIGNQINNQ